MPGFAFWGDFLWADNVRSEQLTNIGKQPSFVDDAECNFACKLLPSNS